MDERPITARYRDPLEAIWVAAAAAVGFRVARSDGVYASSDGRGTLTFGTDETLDPDDCLAQMVLHELCHALVQGPERRHELDFGLCNFDDRDRPREHAALRVQAALTDPHGLRRVLAPTTVYRAWYDALPDDPLAGDDESLVLARQALARADPAPWGPALARALGATRAVLEAALPALDAAAEGLPWLGARLDPPAGRHASGFHRATHGAARGSRCGECAWWHDGHCQAAGLSVEAALPACERWEPHLDCRACGACCHRGFDVVDVDEGEPLRTAHPELLTRDGARWVLTRPGGRCVALRGGPSGEPYACAVYALRPEGCRDLAVGGENCLLARRRAGLTR